MSAAEADLPAELSDAWSKLKRGGDARKLRNHLPALRRSVGGVTELESSLKEAFGGIGPDAVSPDSRASVRTTLVSSLQSHSLSIVGVLNVFSRLSSDAQGAVQSVLGWIAEHLVGILTAFAAHLGLQNWSVAAQLSSFPPGASFTITLTFI
ncbi:MAG: hypothetical protein JRM80_03885 [Nitrososphaerota archaeon]|nr:hypothetical protein [Nitrososphaerota archaeon]